MINVFKVFTWIYGHLYNHKGVPQIFLKPTRFLVRRCANYFLPIYFQHTEKKYKASNTNGKRIIVSLTSFPKRINNVWLVIECILRQTQMPDAVILWLSKEQFPCLYDDLPSNLKNIKNDIFQIRFVDGDIRSHKKYYYAFTEFPEDYVITIDDDIFYPPYMIEGLIRSKMEHDNAVIARYCLVMKYDELENLNSYNDWQEDYNIYTKDVFFGSGGGTLFEPRKMFKDTTNIGLACDLAPLADDVWLNAMVRLASLPICVISNELLLPILIKNNSRLTEINVYENRNDEQIKAVASYYNELIGVNPFSRVDKINKV